MSEYGRKGVRRRPTAMIKPTLRSDLTLGKTDGTRRAAAAVDCEMSTSFSDHPGIQICGIASAVPEHCIDQAMTRDIVLANAPEFRSHEALFQTQG